jgi:hypothetical protein
MGDYIGIVSLNEGACIAYTATFNGEQDIYFVRAELPIHASVAQVGNVARITWNSTLGVNYCVQALADPHHALGIRHQRRLPHRYQQHLVRG